MKGVRVSSRYAKSLLSLAIEQKSADAAYNDMRLIEEVCQSNRDFVLLLKSPVIKADTKIKIIDKIFSGKLTKLTSSFITIIANHRRESLLNEIAGSFVMQYKNYKNIATAEIITAYKIDDTLRKKLADLISKQENREVEIVEKVNKDLIGGIVVRINNRQYDGSVLRKINDLRKDFSKNAYIDQI
ncbi:MAG: ATP synthase F1 subunit delta [Bacteroidota bacterium]